MSAPPPSSPCCTYRPGERVSCAAALRLQETVIIPGPCPHHRPPKSGDRGLPSYVATTDADSPCRARVAALSRNDASRCPLPPSQQRGKPRVHPGVAGRTAPAEQESGRRRHPRAAGRWGAGVRQDRAGCLCHQHDSGGLVPTVTWPSRSDTHGEGRFALKRRGTAGIC